MALEVEEAFKLAGACIGQHSDGIWWLSRCVDSRELGLLHMHYVDRLGRLLATSVVGNVQLFCSSVLERWSLFIRQHKLKDLQVTADSMAL